MLSIVWPRTACNQPAGDQCGRTASPPSSPPGSAARPSDEGTVSGGADEAAQDDVEHLPTYTPVAPILTAHRVTTFGDAPSAEPLTSRG